MPAATVITTQQFSRLIGIPGIPAIVAVHIEDDYRADPRLVPGSLRRDYRAIASWAADYRGKSVVVCQRGQKLSEGTAAWLRHATSKRRPLKAASRLGRGRMNHLSAPTSYPRETTMAARYG